MPLRFYAQERVGLFIDGANLHAAARALGFDIDYKRLLKHFQEQCRLIRAFYYTALVEDQEYSPLRPLVDWLDYNGFTMVTKPTKEFADAMGRRKIKGNMDIELAVDVLEMSAHLDHVVLFSGDGDFRRLVEAVQRRGVRVSGRFHRCRSSRRWWPMSCGARPTCSSRLQKRSAASIGRAHNPRSARHASRHTPQSATPGASPQRARGRTPRRRLSAHAGDCAGEPRPPCAARQLPRPPRLPALSAPRGIPRRASHERCRISSMARAGSFGPMPTPRLLIVGLAPGLHGANRTGRPFTGDWAGVLLRHACSELTLRAACSTTRPDDGLDAGRLPHRQRRALRAAENKPTTAEIATCRQFLNAEHRAVPKLASMVALGAHRP